MSAPATLRLALCFALAKVAGVFSVLGDKVFSCTGCGLVVLLSTICLVVASRGVSVALCGTCLWLVAGQRALCGRLYVSCVGLWLL